MTSSWTPRGQRQLVPYENPQGRRLNVRAAYITHGPQRSLTWGTQRGNLGANQLVAFLSSAIPRPAGQPLVVVLDNGRIHTSGVTKAALPALRQQRIYRYYLPPYSLERNASEAVFGVIKHGDLPERTSTTWEAREEAIDAAFTRYDDRLRASASQLRPTA